MSTPNAQEAEERVVDVNAMEEEDEDAQDLAAMKARVAEMEAEAEKLRELQAGLDASSGGVDDAPEPEDPATVDGRSVYVGNVDYGATPEELQQHFLSCGTINRITILCHKPTGSPKGYAYIEFAEPAGAENAVSALNESTFRQRQLSVVLKRTNVPGMGARGRGRGRGGYRGGYRGRGGGFNPYARGRGGGRGGRGRGRGF